MRYRAFPSNSSFETLKWKSIVIRLPHTNRQVSVTLPIAVFVIAIFKYACSIPNLVYNVKCKYSNVFSKKTICKNYMTKVLEIFLKTIILY